MVLRGSGLTVGGARRPPRSRGWLLGGPFFGAGAFSQSPSGGSRRRRPRSNRPRPTIRRCSAIMSSLPSGTDLWVLGVGDAKAALRRLVAAKKGPAGRSPPCDGGWCHGPGGRGAADLGQSVSGTLGEGHAAETAAQGLEASSRSALPLPTWNWSSPRLRSLSGSRGCSWSSAMAGSGSARRWLSAGRAASDFGVYVTESATEVTLLDPFDVEAAAARVVDLGVPKDHEERLVELPRAVMARLRDHMKVWTPRRLGMLSCSPTGTASWSGGRSCPVRCGRRLLSRSVSSIANCIRCGDCGLGLAGRPWASVEWVRDQLGHADLRTTQKYLAAFSLGRGPSVMDRVDAVLEAEWSGEKDDA